MLFEIDRKDVTTAGANWTETWNKSHSNNQMYFGKPCLGRFYRGRMVCLRETDLSFWDIATKTSSTVDMVLGYYAKTQ